MDYLTTKDIMAKYKVTRMTVYNWVKQGMPNYKFGKLIRFSEEEVEKWNNERKDV